MSTKEKIAKLVKTYRKSQGVTQKKLADGICAQTIISKIENSDITPSVDLFFSIVKKLEIPPQEVLKTFDIDYQDDKCEYNTELRNLFYRKDYKTLDYLLSTISSYRISNENEKNLFRWLKSVIKFHYFGDKKGGISDLTELISTLNQNDGRVYSRSICSLADMKLIEGEYEIASQLYTELLPDLKYSESMEYKVSVLHGLSKSKLALNQQSDAVQYCLIEIDILLNNNSLYNLGEAFFHLAQIYKVQSMRQECDNAIRKAISIFEITGNELLKNQATTFHTNIEKKTSKLSNKVQKSVV